jgi:molybdate transport system ATP-binding protein
VGPATEVLSDPLASFDRREAGVLLEGRVESIDERHRIATVALKSARLYVPEANLLPGKPVRVRIPARDVMLATERPEGLSALNILDGTVRELKPAGEATVDVVADCAGDLIMSRITGLSAERLKLREGIPVFVIVKTVALEP